MALAQWKYTEGTIKNPQHTKSSEVCFTETSLVHFPDGKLTPIPAFVASTTAGSIVGRCRSIFAATLNTTNYVGSHFLFGTHSRLFAEFKSRYYNITPLVTTATATLGANPLSVTNTLTAMTVTYTAHGLAIGDRIKLSGATAVGGVLVGAINKEHIVATVPTANTFTITVTAATSTATGGGAAIEIFKQIAAGNEYQAFKKGFGAGLFGRGLFGRSRTSNFTPTYPRIWSFDKFGNNIVMCAGDYATGDGQKLYIWSGDNTTAPIVITNAPTDCQWVLVASSSIIALCGNVIKISDDKGDETDWTGGSSNLLTVRDSVKLLSGVKFGDKSAIIFAPSPYLLTFAGDRWDLLALGEEYPIAAPQAFAQYRDGIIWYSVDGNFYFYNGSTVERIVNYQNGEYIRDRLNQNAIWTCFMMRDQKHNQSWLYYPANTSQDPNEYVIINPREYRGGVPPSFTLGTQSRTAAQRPNAISGKYYTIDNATSYSSFTNQVVAFAWEAICAFFFIDRNVRMRLNYLMPNSYTAGQYDITVYGKENPQGTESTYGTFAIVASTSRRVVKGAGRLMAFKFAGTGDATIIDMDMEVQAQGTRSA